MSVRRGWIVAAALLALILIVATFPMRLALALSGATEAGIAVREFPGLVDALGEGKLSEEQLRVLTGAGLSVSHVDAVEQSARRGEFVRVMLAELDSRVLPPKALRMAAARVAELTRPGDLVLTVGAGDVTEIGPAVLDLLGAPAP